MKLGQIDVVVFFSCFLLDLLNLKTMAYYFRKDGTFLELIDLHSVFWPQSEPAQF